MLYRSNKVMYDRLTETLWSQLRGEPILGELVGSGIKLEYFPVALTTWGEWLAEHPDTKVQSRETGYYGARSYVREDDRRSIYFAYREDPETMFPIWNRDDSLASKQLVLGVVAEGAYKAYSIDALNESRLVNDNVGGVDLVVVSSYLSADALAFRSERHSVHAAGRCTRRPANYAAGRGWRGVECGARQNLEGRGSLSDIASTSGECIVLVRLVYYPPGYAIIRGDGGLTWRRKKLMAG